MKTKKIAKIAKKVREEAWLICAIAASEPEHVSVREVATRLGIQLINPIDAIPECDLALLAWWEVERRHIEDLSCPEVYAEAAALLAEGWTP